MVNRVVNTQKTVVGMSKNMNRYRRILVVVPLNIKLQLSIRRMCVDFCRDSASALVKQSQDTFINVVVNQNDPADCTFDQLRGKFISIVDLPFKKHAFNRRQCSAVRTKNSILSSVRLTRCSSRSNR